MNTRPIRNDDDLKAAFRRLEAIKFGMERQGLTARDLEPFIGPTARDG